MKEKNIQSLVLMKATELGSRLFRVNVGQAWTGNKIIKQGRDVIIKDARPFNVGVPKGFSDCVGLNTIEITPEMVGKKVAVFTAAEIKNETGRLTTEQSNFLAFVREAGGIAGRIRSPEEYASMLNHYLSCMQTGQK